MEFVTQSFTEKAQSTTEGKKTLCNSVPSLWFSVSREMLLTKEHTPKLPESFPVDFIAKVEKGLAQSQEGEINTKEQTKDKLSKWLK